MVKKLKIIVVLVVALATLGFGLNFILHQDAKRLKGYEEATIPIGVTKAKEECYKEGQSQDVCESITGVSSASECDARVCWIVTANANDVAKFSSGVIVVKNDGSYVAKEYTRSKIIPKYN